MKHIRVDARHHPRNARNMLKRLSENQRLEFVVVTWRGAMAPRRVEQETLDRAEHLVGLVRARGWEAYIHVGVAARGAERVSVYA